MPRENSFSDSDGRSLTPDLEDELSPTSPTQAGPPSLPQIQTDVGDRGRSQPTRRPTVQHAAGTASSPPLDARVRSPARQSVNATNEYPPQRSSTLTPGDRFRQSVRKVIAMRRGSVALSGVRIGAEPGVDPRRASAFMAYGHIKQKCLIEIIDYSAVRSSFGRMTNQEFIKLLSDERASEKEPWVKVRWINVGGVSWDVISALAIRYNMHPLAVEDLLHFRKTARSKADYYQQHLFLRILSHSLVQDDAAVDESLSNSYTQLPRSASPIPIDDDDESWDDNKEDEEKTVNGNSRFTTFRSGTIQSAVKRRLGSLPADIESLPQRVQPGKFDAYNTFEGDAIKKRKDDQNRKIIRALKKGDRVNVKISPMCIFLFRDGTVVTVHHDTQLALTAPITERLRQRDTGLRSTADASLLVQSLLDLIVDKALVVVEEYQSKILKLEQSVLLKPHVSHVRRLHILQGDLILHKRTLEPIKTVIYGLRRYDVDRVAALEELVDPTRKIQGYMSHKAKIYLADVHDHMEYILSSLDMFAGISENLINYTFNMSSYEMNEVMRRLTLATIIFLPLTLLTGYFGMNFSSMWTIDHGHTDLVFWIIALPLMAIVVPVFLWSDLQRMVHYIQKKMAKRDVKRKVKQA